MSLKDTFNELAALEAVYDAWGAASVEKLPEAAQEALSEDLMVKNPQNLVFTALDMAPFQKALKAGPEAATQEGCDVILKFLKQADYNIGIIAPFMKAADAKAAMPATRPENLAALCKKHGLKNLPKLI